MTQKVFIITWLHQNTARNDITWDENKYGESFTVVNGIEIVRTIVAQRVNSFSRFSFSIGSEKAFIDEPESDGLFRKIHHGEKAELVGAMRLLSREIDIQSEKRSQFYKEHKQEIEQKIFSKLLFGLGKT
jgi:hypothetical protein